MSSQTGRRHDERPATPAPTLRPHAADKPLLSADMRGHPIPFPITPQRASGTAPIASMRRHDPPRGMRSSP
eukprot:1841136-Prymnesium_polylepis.1